MSNPTYSDIIDPETYNKLMTEQHIYLKASDVAIEMAIRAQLDDSRKTTEIVELGCGPSRISGRLASLPGATYTGVDHDEEFLKYAREKNLKLTYTLADVSQYKHHCPVDIFVSQGMHHHIPKGMPTQTYLKNVYDNLKPGGVYILSDEFLAEYDNEDSQARQVQATLWYSHVIVNALVNGYQLLAEEEAKTFLDDIAEGKDNIKTKKQIENVLEGVYAIQYKARRGNRESAHMLCLILLDQVRVGKAQVPSGDSRFDLSRGDFKVCGSVFQKEALEAGFHISNTTHIGPIDHIGGFSIYTLLKP